MQETTDKVEHSICFICKMISVNKTVFFVSATKRRSFLKLIFKFLTFTFPVTRLFTVQKIGE